MKNRLSQMFKPYPGEISFSLWNFSWPIILWAITLFANYKLPALLGIPMHVPGDSIAMPWARLAIILPLPLIVFYIEYKHSNNVMKRHWGEFREHLWKNLLITVILFVIIMTLSYGVFKPLLTHVFNPASGLTLNGGATLLLGSLVPMTAPFTEEIAVHYLISEQFTDTKAKLWFGILISNILFAFIHVFATDFSIYMLIFYFLMGIMFHLVSLYFKNIWFNIFTHFWWNLLGAAGGIIGFIVILFS